MKSQTVLDFWFGAPGVGAPDAARPEWFRKDARFDSCIVTQFGDLVQEALAGGLRHWSGAQAGLARILLLDQFTRNAYRGTPQSFAGDALALAAARELVAAGADLELAPWRRAFVYLPYEHAEDGATQDEALALFTRLRAAAPGLDGMLDFARRHREVIARFGRFPHRNAILGRASTPAELEWLSQPGAGF
ncbi:uncharacterized protein (DUF924 family) [Oxalobacteraceae bacterium GrIS 1.11]